MVKSEIVPLRIVVDSREKRPWLFSGYPDVEVVRGTLKTGDYSLPGFEDQVALERKSLQDLIGSLSAGRDRFEREMERLAAMEFAAVLVEASAEDIAKGKFRGNMNPTSVLQSIYSWTVRHNVHFLLCGTRKHAEYACHGLLSKFIREHLSREGACASDAYREVRAITAM
ncbi:ERCC4 domain-containing protein [Fundidesulfovibrio putealis]|uniref:ERCC4 domain-containing protein n=1 Tax=Fundidesulfovibrio putealis TaxID=270496 RepID=UPI0012EB5C93|nr:ERCC4 domain-containing protein [Fundidesulfovibrio putealis]